jgi:hypothetical protein
VFHTAVAGDIPEGVTSVANIDFLWARLLFCHKSVGSSVHGSVLIESGLHIAQICEALGCSSVRHPEQNPVFNMRATMLNKT